MPRQGLTNEAILQVAYDMLIDKGLENLQLMDVAKRCKMKSPSMYNHFKGGISEIKALLANRIVAENNEQQMQAIQGLQRDDALRALADAQYTYASTNPELYEVILTLPALGLSSAADTVKPILNVLDQYNLSDADTIHLHRMYRSFVHGYIELSRAGYLSHRSISTHESYNASIEYYIEMVNGLERKYESQNESKK